MLLASPLAVALLWLVNPRPTPASTAGANLFEQARQARRKGDLATAVHLYEEARQEHPENGPVTLELAETLTDLGQAAKAEPLLLWLLQQSPQRPEPHRAIVWVYLQEAKTAQALAEAQRAVELQDNPETQLALGAALRAAGRALEAIPHLEKAAQGQPGDARSLVELALGYGDVEDPRTSTAFENAIAAAPRNPAIRVQYAASLWQEKNFDKGNREMEEALRLTHDNSKLLVQYGISLTGQGRSSSNQRAVEILQKAWNAGERGYDVAFTLGWTLGETGNFVEGIRFLREAVLRNDQNALAHDSLGELLLLDHQPVEAAAEFERAAALQPQSATFRLDVGSAYEASRNLDKAEASYREAIRLDPALAKVHYMLGNLLARTGRRTEAAQQIATYQAAFQKQQQTQLENGSRRAQINLGWVELRGQRPERALEIFDRFPEDAEALRGAAEALLQLGRRSEALRRYEHAIELAPDDVALRYELDREYGPAKTH